METRGLNCIYYVRPECSMAFRMDDALANPDDLLSTHKFLINTECDDLEEIFQEMQAENWSPNGEARGLIKSLALEHTSMSVGDIVEIGGTPYQALPSYGFVNLRTGMNAIEDEEENRNDAQVVAGSKVFVKLASPSAVQSSISIDSPDTGIKEILNQMLSCKDSLGLEGLAKSEVKVLAKIAWRSLKDVYASRLDSEDPKYMFRRIFREDVDRVVADIAFGYTEGHISIVV